MLRSINEIGPQEMSLEPELLTARAASGWNEAQLISA